MTADTTPGEERRPAGTARAARLGQWLRRAAGSAAHERHTVLVVGKSTLAAVIAWAIASQLLHAQSPAFAPFSAVLMMQVTVYQSVVQALRYVGAVVAGVALQGVLGFLAGPDLMTFALVALVALTIGRWRPLGTQGSQVATAAFFAFSSYITAASTADRLTALGQIIVLVLVGCGVGVAVNLLVFPPMRYRSAEYGVRNLARSVCDLLSDVYPALREERELDEERTGRWRRRATALSGTVTQAYSAVETARESLWYNPRRLLHRHRAKETFSGYQAVVEALERVCSQLVSLTRSLDQWHDREESTGYGDFLHGYGDLLACLAAISRQLSELDEDRLAAQSRALDGAAEEAQEVWRRLAETTERSPLPVDDLARPYGVMLVEAARLTEEFQYACDLVRHSVDRPASRRP
ncbi:aromatic acid exporter family protein [Streptomyces sp. TRM70308]|uniref:FUSC family protein n=1 Tax=Streptomyces sp. TRM70308 TaxID=3131932 RepID=UPI003CFCD5C0